MLNHLKILQRVLYRFHFLYRWMLSLLFQFLHRIRSIIHRQAQLPLHLCDICCMYLETIFRFYILLNHFISNTLFRLVRFGSLGYIIKRNFTFSLAKLDFYIDYTVSFFCGKALQPSQHDVHCPN